MHEHDIKSIARNGIFLPIITKNFLESIYCMSEVEKVLYNSNDCDVIFKPVCVDMLSNYAEMKLPSSARQYKIFSLDYTSGTDKNHMDNLLSFIEKDNRLY